MYRTLLHTLAALCVCTFARSCNMNEVITAEPEPEVHAEAVRVFEYTPAPGQFINDMAMSGITTADGACAYAESMLQKGSFVSLGAFGGRLVVGFDHRIIAAGDGGYDIAVRGNPFDVCNEPAVVWVMQDDNGNGLPDDVWYRLAGSDDNDPQSVADYSVTYTRSSGDVPWSDNLGASGKVERNEFHTQPSYYPAWIVDNTYTLAGFRLPDNTSFEHSDRFGTAIWITRPFGWGYADNCGSDRENGWNRFRIADAVNADGSPASLACVDFVKVQCAVQASCPAVEGVSSADIGEVSAEVLGIADYAMLKDTF